MKTVVLLTIIYFALISPVLTKTCSLYTNQKELVTANCMRKNLQRVPDNLNATIQVFDLRENLITDITNASFINYTSLVSLFLDKNEIRFIHPGGLDGLYNLQELTLSENFLNISSEDGKRILKSIPNINILDFSEQRMDTMNESNLSGFLKYPNAEFKNLHHLRNLSLDLYGYPAFGCGFQYLNLSYLRFSSCKLRILQNHTFNDFSASVKEIHLSHCSQIIVDKIEFGAFSPFPHLLSLDLSWTAITLTKGIQLLYPFRNKSFEVLNLGHMSNTAINRTSTPNAIILSPSAVYNLNTICVKTLIIADNNIVDLLPNSLFSSDHIQCLEIVDVSANRFGFSALSPLELFSYSSKLSNLKILDFSYLPLKYISEKFLPYAESNDTKPYYPAHDTSVEDEVYCSKLSKSTFYIILPPRLGYIRITHVMGAPDHRSLKIVNASSLTYVDMSYYRVRCFPEILLDESENNLSYLDISGINCKLYFNKTTIPVFPRLKTLVISDASFYQAINENKNLFKFTPMLNTLDLSSNSMWKLPEMYLSQLPFLTELNLCHNQFKRIPTGVKTLQNLRVLDMSYNRMVTIEQNIIDWIDEQQRRLGNFYLKIRGNDFICSCETRYFIRWLNVATIKFDQETYRCNLPNETTGTVAAVYEQYHTIFADCDSHAWLRVGVIIIVSFFAVLLPVAVIFNFRWRIAFLCYRKFRKIVEGTLNLNYSYDVYVSYGYDGYTWVQEILVSMLEDCWGLKACIEDRDFVCERSTYDQIGNAIDKSRHMIFVVTSDFMSKPFAAYELDRARTAKSSRTLQQIILIILLQNTEDFPIELQSISSDALIIEWSQHLEDTQSSVDNLRTKVLLNF